MNLDQLRQLQLPPAPFAPGAAMFWDDPHISAQMLAAHLDPGTAAASRPPAAIERSVAWLIDALGLAPGDPLLDLGCGPGLYASRLAARGLRVTGVDLSPRSIDYAAAYARAHQLDISYRCQNYLTLTDERAYAAALLIYGDFCVLDPAKRGLLLANIHRALWPGGRLALDVSTRAHRRRHGLANRWRALDGGFWRPGPHLVLEQGFDYPAESLFLDQYIVVEPDGTTTVYRNWFQDYSPQSIRAELAAHGFAATGLWGDLAGAPLAEDGEWIGVVAEASWPGNLSEA